MKMIRKSGLKEFLQLQYPKKKKPANFEKR